MSAAVSTRPCPRCLRPVPLGERCEREDSHAIERMKVARRNAERRMVAGVWKARGRELVKAPPADLPIVTVALVGCGKVKAANPATARELYRSPLFAKSVTLAELAADATFVASAGRNHLLELEEIVEPYDVSLRAFDRGARERWASCLLGDLIARFPGRRVKLVLLMGETYAEPIVEAVRELRRAWPSPTLLLEGLTVGRRLSFLNVAIAAARTARGVR